MIRVLIEYLLPLLLPTAIFVIWRLLRTRTAGPAAETPSLLQKGPWFWLIVSGVALAAISLAIGALRSGYDPSGTYVAPHSEGGRVVPGRVE